MNGTDHFEWREVNESKYLNIGEYEHCMKYEMWCTGIGQRHHRLTLAAITIVCDGEHPIAHASKKLDRHFGHLRFPEVTFSFIWLDI